MIGDDGIRVGRPVLSRRSPLTTFRDRGAVCALVALAVAGSAGCGSSSPKVPSEQRLESVVGRYGGTLDLAVPDVPATLDPLAASSTGGLEVVRQVVEPLVERLHAPEGGTEVSRGPAIGLEPSVDRRHWTIELRRGVRFQDGAALDAQAVAANARRWRTTAAGRKVLPGLDTVRVLDGHRVKLRFFAPVDAPSLLMSPQLGLVSPRALDPPTGVRSTVKQAGGLGTGPFALGSRTADSAVELVRNKSWWGVRLGLGPSLDGLRFTGVPGARDRVQALLDGVDRVAVGVSSEDRAMLRRDPNVYTLRSSAGTFVAVRRSVRGIDVGDGVMGSLSGAWLTDVDARDGLDA